jgi:S1-C subfamily serine protease
VAGQLLISTVGTNGYFANAGFQPGDQIISAGGQQFANQEGFYNWLGTVQVSQRIPFLISRNGQQQTVYWTPTAQFVQEYAQAAPSGAQISFLGIQLDDQIEDAAIVAEVQAGTPAQRAGIRPKDVIIGVNGQQISSPDEFANATGGIQPGTAVDLAISRSMNVQLIPGGDQAQTGRSQNLTGAPVAPAPVVSPAPVQPVPVAPAPILRRGLFRN